MFTVDQIKLSKSPPPGSYNIDIKHRIVGGSKMYLFMRLNPLEKAKEMELLRMHSFKG